MFIRHRIFAVPGCVLVMAPQVRRSKTAQSAQLKQYGDARTTEWVVPEEGHTVLEVQKVRDPPRWKDVPIAKNYMIPPYHWHWFQEEHFDIKKGYVLVK